MDQTVLKNYYEKDAARFWDPRLGFTGRDLDVYPLLSDTSGACLEYGCGSGSLIFNLAAEDRYTRCVGADISETALHTLRGYCEISEQGSKMELLLPFEDTLPTVQPESMDVVISVATIEHVVNPYTVLDELHRVTRKDGTLICSVPNYGYLKHIVYLLLGRQPRTGTDLPVSKWREDGWDGMHLHTFTKSSFDTLLRDCGWLPQRWIGCGSRLNWTGIGYLRRNWPSLWSGELIVRCKKIQHPGCAEV